MMMDTIFDIWGYDFIIISGVQYTSYTSIRWGKIIMSDYPKIIQTQA